MGNPTKQSAQVKGVHIVGSFEKKGLLAYLFFFFFFSIFFAGCCLLNSNWQDTFAFKIKQIIMTNMVLCTEHSTCYITNIIAATLLAANSSTCVKSTERAREGRYHTVSTAQYSAVQKAYWKRWHGKNAVPLKIQSSVCCSQCKCQLHSMCPLHYLLPRCNQILTWLRSK